MTPPTVVIDARFRGPPDSGNGGYTCGLVAGAIEGPAVVSLRSPPPLDRPLALVAEGAGARLLDGETLVAEGEQADADPAGEPPGFVPLEAARSASRESFYLSESHPFPTCFVCGPRRGEGDGLQIYPGPHDGMFAAPWVPPAVLACEDGSVPPEIVWAALDCPTSAPGMNEPGPDGKVLPIVLARLAVDLRERVIAGRDHVITSWEIGRDGRKREAGAALWDAGGGLLASARALWIELRAPAS